MPDKLLPCPFCGATPLFHPVEINEIYFEKCFSCGAEGPSEYGEALALQRWNSRPLDSALRSACRALVEKWRDMKPMIPGWTSLRAEYRKECAYELEAALGDKHAN